MPNEGEHGWGCVNDVEGLLAHQEEGESSEAHTSSSKQCRLHWRVLTDLSGTVGELTEPLLWKQQNKTREMLGWEKENVWYLSTTVPTWNYSKQNVAVFLEIMQKLFNLQLNMNYFSCFSSISKTTRNWDAVQPLQQLHFSFMFSNWRQSTSECTCTAPGVPLLYSCLFFYSYHANFQYG